MAETKAGLKIVRPEATENLITNPSFETATTGWTAVVSATLARDAVQQRRGVYSLKVTPGAVATAGAQWTQASPTASAAYTFSVDLKGVAGKTYRLLMTQSGPGTLGSLDVTGDGKWHRYAITGTTANTNDLVCSVRRINDSSTDPYYLDGAQLEQKAYATTYCDGDQRGFRLPLPFGQPAYWWTGAPHASTSKRSALSAHGGRAVDLDSLGAAANLKVMAAQGAGLPPVRHNTLDYALLPGASFQGARVEPRALTVLAYTDTDDWDDVFAVWDQFEQEVAFSRAPGPQPLLLEFIETGHRLACVYDSGSEADIRADNGEVWANMALRFMAYDPPHWGADGQEGAVLDFTETVADTYGLIRRASGQWQGMNVGIDAHSVYAIAVDPNHRRRVYVGGWFSILGATACDNLGLYDPDTDTFTNIGDITKSGGGASVNALAVLPDGRLVVAGTFDDAGGTAADNIAIYDPDADTWSAVGAGTNGTINAVAVDPVTGDIYVGGNFTAPFTDLAYWDVSASAWATLGSGTSGGSGIVFGMCFGLDENLYVVGNFTAINGVSATNCAYYDGTWHAMGSGLGDSGFVCLADKNGDIVIGGRFTTVEAGGVTANKIIGWNGHAFYPLAGGLSAAVGSEFVYALALGRDGNLWAGGSFGGGVVPNADGLALWNRSAFAQLDVNLPATMVVQALAVCPTTGDVYVGFDYLAASSSPGSALNTVTNTGTADAYPVIELAGPARFVWIENQTTGERLYLNLVVLAGETVTLDCARKVVESDWGAYRVLAGIQPGSDFGRFHLAPGANTIAVFALSTTADTAARAYWDIMHLSAYGGVSD